MVADINLDVRGYSQEAGLAVYRQILDRLQAAPGVAAAGAARVTVLSGGARTVSISVDGQRIREDAANGLDVRVNVVSDGYLGALGIPILRGRDFTPADGPASAPVAIVSESLAARLWPGIDPLGQSHRRRRRHRLSGGRGTRYGLRQRGRAQPAAVLLRAAGAELRSRRGNARPPHRGGSARAVAGDSRRGARRRSAPCRGQAAAAPRHLRRVDRQPADDGDPGRRLRRAGAAAGDGRGLRDHGARGGAAAARRSASGWRSAPHHRLSSV